VLQPGRESGQFHILPWLGRDHADLGDAMSEQIRFPREVAGIAGPAIEFSARCPPAFERGAAVGPEQARSLGVGLAGAALANALAQNGWSAESLPGRPIVMRHGEATLEPFAEVNRLARGEVDADAWQRRCWALGIRDLGLMPV
jgi:hypothetical protein